jgi:hypothetical protein
MTPPVSTNMSYRKLVMRMDGDQALEVIKIASGVLGGALGLRVLDWWGKHRTSRIKEPVELTARILDDGDRVREMLFEDNKVLRVSRDAAVERAHVAELALTAEKAHNALIQRRLERKDIANTALIGQLAQLGQIPVIFQRENWIVQDVGHTPGPFKPEGD